MSKILRQEVCRFSLARPTMCSTNIWMSRKLLAVLQLFGECLQCCFAFVDLFNGHSFSCGVIKCLPYLAVIPIANYVEESVLVVYHVLICCGSSLDLQIGNLGLRSLRVHQVSKRFHRQFTRGEQENLCSKVLWISTSLAVWI